MCERVNAGGPYMRLDKSPNRITAFYSNGVVHSIDISLQGNRDMCCVSVNYKDGSLYTWKSAHIYFVALSMYGIAISRDGKYLFAPQNMNGLVCLDLKSGSVVWKSKSKAEYSHILACDQTICCAKSRDEIQVLNALTGEVLLSRKVPFDNRFDVLNDKMIFNHSFSKKWEVLNPETLTIIQTITQKDIDKDSNKEIWKRLYQDWQ